MHVLQVLDVFLVGEFDFLQKSSPHFSMLPQTSDYVLIDLDHLLLASLHISLEVYNIRVHLLVDLFFVVILY
jgi:hypothetical protein